MHDIEYNQVNCIDIWADVMCKYVGASHSYEIVAKMY